MINLTYFIDLFSEYFLGGIFEFLILPILCMAFVATIPCIVRSIIFLRGK